MAKLTKEQCIELLDVAEDNIREAINCLKFLYDRKPELQGIMHTRLI